MGYRQDWIAEGGPGDFDQWIRQRLGIGPNVDIMETILAMEAP